LHYRQHIKAGNALLGRRRRPSQGRIDRKNAETDCLLIGSLSQFNRLTQKLNKQPFGLNELSRDISTTLDNYQKDKFLLKIGGHKLRLGKRTFIMGIINLTPDSFSQDGWYRNNSNNDKLSIENIVRFAQGLIKQGADIIDVGGESSRPHAAPVKLKEELRRTIPIIRRLSRTIKAPISIDTYKPEVARQALDNGASIVNDITALRNHAMAKIASRYEAGVILMHMKGAPSTMQRKPVYGSILDEIIGYLDKAVERAESFGINKDKIIIDPGIGFGKTEADNLKIINNLKEFKVLGCPILVGTSRKSFIGRILNRALQERIFGTVASCVLAAKNGANILRVHDVSEVAQALRIADAVNKLC